MRYDYKCKICGNIQEIEHKLNDKNIEPCKKCSAPPEKMEKQLSGFGSHSSWSKWKTE